MKRKIFIVLLSILMVITLVGCGGSNGATSKSDTEGKDLEKITLRLSHIGSPDHPWHKGLEKFVEKVNKDTNGQVIIEIYPNASLSEGNERTMVEQLQMGTLDMALFPAAQGGNEFSAFGLPFQFSSREAVLEMLTTDVALEMMEGLEGKGIKGLAYWENGFRQITNSVRSIKTPADMKGLKIRAPQVPHILASLSALGANTMSVSLGEVYVAMQQGVVDGQENPLSTIYNNRFYEVQKYCTIFNYQWSAQVLGIHTETYNNLSDDIKKILTEAAREMSVYTSNLLDEEDQRLIEELRKNGMEIYVPTAEELALFRAATDTEKLKDTYREIVGKDLMNRFMAKAKEINDKHK